SRLFIDPKFPTQNSTFRFSYDAGGSELEGAGDVSALVYVYDSKGYYVEEKSLTKSGSRYSASVTLPADATVVGFVFSAGDKKDNNSKKGYVTQVYDDKQQPVMGSYKTMYSLYGEYAGYELGIERNPEAGLPYIEKEYKTYP